MIGTALHILILKKNFMSYITKSYLTTQFTNFATRIATVFAKKTELPTKTSELTNDSNYVSDASYVHTDNNYTSADKTKVNNAVLTSVQTLTDTQKAQARTNIGAGTSSFSGSYNDLTNKPTIPTVNNGTLTIQKNGENVQTFTANQSSNVTANITVPTTTSELTNNSGFITKAVSDLTNYYNKSNTYSKTEIDGLISSAKSGRFVVVDSLPTTDIKTDVIYLVPSATSQTSNVKDEYINLDGTTSGWELIGSTAVDLSGYLKKTDAESTYVKITDTESSNIDFSTYFG